MKLAPIVLFVYNRPEHTKKTLNALKKNILAKESKLFIFSDSAKSEKDVEKVNEVRKIIKNITGFKSVNIFNSKKNNGLANSIIIGVSKIIKKYGKVIVLEDDLITSKYFLKYMNKALDTYENNLNIIGISGYVYPINNLPDLFFIKGADCWGWATWARGWNIFESDGKKLLKNLEKKELISNFNFNNSYKYSKMLKDQIDGKNNSWAVRWYASAFLKNKLTLYPGKSFVFNIGIDSTGTHGGKNNIYDVELNNKIPDFDNLAIVEDVKSREKFEHFFRNNSNLIYRLFKKLNLFLKGE